MTNRNLVRGDFLQQIEKVTAMKPEALILREKDLSEKAYGVLAAKVLNLCNKADIPCYFNSQPELAVKLGADGVQLSFAAARSLSRELRRSLCRLGISIHSEEEAIQAQSMDAAYIIYGHIFATDCKKDVPPRGLDALRRICNSVCIPVFAIGGIDEQNAPLCIDAGAYGVCMMSGFMRA